MGNRANVVVGILAANNRLGKRALSQYSPYSPNGVKLFSFTASSIDWNRRRITGLHRSRGRWAVSRFPYPKVVYNRHYGIGQETIGRLSAAIGSRNIINSINRFDKLDIDLMLRDSIGDRLPETASYDEDALIRMLDRHRVVYLKPRFGHRGLGVFRAELAPSGEIRFGHHYYAPLAVIGDAARFREGLELLIGTEPYLIQAGIPIVQAGGSIFDLRALVQKGRDGAWSVTNVVSRIACEGSYNTSIYERVSASRELLERLYTPTRAQAILTAIGEISLAVAQRLDADPRYQLGEFSVDYALDGNGHPWIIELNGMPQKELYEGIGSRREAYRRPLEYARYLAGDNPLRR